MQTKALNRCSQHQADQISRLPGSRVLCDANEHFNQTVYLAVQQVVE